MSLSVHAAPAAAAALARSHAAPANPHTGELNPAQQARAADPTAKGAAFGALVSQFARAKHTPAPPLVTTPPPADPPVDPNAQTHVEPPVEPPVTPPLDLAVQPPPIDAETQPSLDILV